MSRAWIMACSGGVKPRRRRQRHGGRTRRLDRVVRFGDGSAQFIERCNLISRRPHRVFDARNRQIGHAGCKPVAAFCRRRIGFRQRLAIGSGRTLVRTGRIAAAITACVTTACATAAYVQEFESLRARQYDQRLTLISAAAPTPHTPLGHTTGRQIGWRRPTALRKTA